MLAPLVRTVRRAPGTHPCPCCGKPGNRKRLLCRRIRTLAYRQVAFLDVHYAEYHARCGCRKSFRSWPLDVPPRSRYCPLVRRAVLDRLLGDSLNVERTREAMKRDFLLELSAGFVYDCLGRELRRLDLPARRRRTLEGFAGTLCVDELHPGRHALLLATDPLADEVVGFALVGDNDLAHMRRFLLTLRAHGFLPEVVITDGSNLYPPALAEVWPRAKHQLCVFHVLKGVNEKVLDAVRRLRRRMARRGNAGRRGKPGRPRKGARRRGRRASEGPTNREKAAFIFKRRYLIVKRAEGLSEQERADPGRMFGYLPGLRALWEFSQGTRRAWGTEQSLKVARWRWTRLRNKPEYQAVPELARALEGLGKGKLGKTLAFLAQPPSERQRTNNHVERMNRRLRFDEKVRYRWRSRKSIVRWVLLRISRHAPGPKGRGPQPPPPRRPGG
jgi:transposase-like protein